MDHSLNNYVPLLIKQIEGKKHIFIYILGQQSFYREEEAKTSNWYTENHL